MMDNRFDLQEIWKDEVKRKKIIAVGSVLIAFLIFLSFYYTGKEEEQKSLSEIPMTEAEEVTAYNNKLQAVNDTVKQQDYFQKELDDFFAGTNTEQSQYVDEERKADSLSKVFASLDKKTNTSSVAVPSKYSSTQDRQPQTAYNTHTNSYQPIISEEQSLGKGLSQSREQIGKDVSLKTEAQILEDRRNALKGDKTISGTKRKALSVPGVIRGTQSKRSNEDLVIITSKEMTVNGVSIPKNTYLYGKLQLANNRAYASISAINLRGSIIPVDIELYGLDGNKGIPIQNATLQSTGEVLSQEASNTISRTGQVGRIVNAVGTSLKSTKDREVTFIDNQSVILYVK